MIRKHIADFITRRDGPEYPGDPTKINLLNGATDGIKAAFFMCMDPHVDCGVMIPIPQYPIYTASIAEFGAKKVRSDYHGLENNYLLRLNLGVRNMVCVEILPHTQYCLCYRQYCNTNTQFSRSLRNYIVLQYCKMQWNVSELSSRIPSTLGKFNLEAEWPTLLKFSG